MTILSQGKVSIFYYILYILTNIHVHDTTSHTFSRLGFTTIIFLNFTREKTLRSMIACDFRWYLKRNWIISQAYYFIFPLTMISSGFKTCFLVYFCTATFAIVVKTATERYCFPALRMTTTYKSGIGDHCKRR